VRGLEEARALLEVRKLLGCLQYIHYAMLNSTDTKDILFLSDPGAPRGRAAAARAAGHRSRGRHCLLDAPAVYFITCFSLQSYTVFLCKNCNEGRLNVRLAHG
jgi:hypothetical protein